MKRTRRRATPVVVELEPRCLLSATGPTATWLGQDGVDLVGQSSTPGPNGVQDIDIQLTGLPANLSIVKADITGYGGGEWEYNGPYGIWAAALVQAPGATTADLYIEPYQVETGRTFEITLTYSDGSTAAIGLNGGTANPDDFMPADTLAAQWLGQDGHDLTGLGPDVGPDGFQDVDLALSNLDSTTTVQSVTVSSSSGTNWVFGLNPDLANNAELVANASDPTQADLYFSPVGDMNGQSLTVTVAYANGTTDSTLLIAGSTDPTLAMPAPAPVSLTWSAITVNWLGQDGQNLTGPGSVHLALSGLPAGQTVVSATLSDEARGSWYYSNTGTADPNDPSALPMAFQTDANPTDADIDFPPIRDESNSTLTLVLVLDDGTTLVTRFVGGACDPGLRSPGITSTSVTATPGDDLEALANEYGTVYLTAGTYALSQPLVLNQPVTITAEPGATLVFTQPAGAPAWTAAIKINAGHTTLEGFAVRFTGPVDWNQAVDYGPAVIGTTDNLDPGPDNLIEDVTISNLNIQAPPAATSWEAAPSLMRLVTAQDGTITNNTLKGGTIEFTGGPWQIVGNTYQGTMPDTYSLGVLSGSYTHDVTIANNFVESTGPSGKTYRFLVLTQGGVDDVIQNNTVIGVGPMDDDTVPDPNASEIILTESYRLHYEGIVSSVSPDGWVVQIPTPQGGEANTGDVLAILTGPQAGQWRMIAQALGPDTYLLDAPITPGSFDVSITQAGFVNETFAGNTVDARGSSTATDLVLAGNNFGTQVVNNTFLGGAQGFDISAYPTEEPDIWGWSHAPALGLVIAGNTIEDARVGGTLDVSHSAAIKSDEGRVYMSATLTNNTVIWTAAFLATLANGGTESVPTAFAVGDSLSSDPGELVLTEQGNLVQPPPDIAPGATLQVNSAVVNGQAITDQALILPTIAVTPPPPVPVTPPPVPVTPPVVAPAPPPVVPTPPVVTPAPTTAAQDVGPAKARKTKKKPVVKPAHVATAKKKLAVRLKTAKVPAKTHVTPARRARKLSAR